MQRGAGRMARPEGIGGKPMVVAFARVFVVLLVVSVLFQLLLGWEDFSRAGWPLGMVLRKVPIAAGVALIAAGAVLIFQRPDNDDSDD